MNVNRLVPDVIYTIAKGLSDYGKLNSYVELGVYKGRTFKRVAPIAKKSYAVDISDKYFKNFDNIKNAELIHGSTDEFLKSNISKKMKFDLIFIDANHKFENSFSEFCLSLQLINDNGLILLHDTYPASQEWISEDGDRKCGDTWKTALKIKNDYSDVCEIVTLPFYHGISIVRKINKTEQLDWMN